jgi:hypothetical protein
MRQREFGFVLIAFLADFDLPRGGHAFWKWWCINAPERRRPTEFWGVWFAARVRIQQKGEAFFSFGHIPSSGRVIVAELFHSSGDELLKSQTRGP